MPGWEKTLLIQTSRTVAVSHLQFGAKLENLWFKGEALQRSWISLGFMTETLSASKGLPVTGAAAKSKTPKSFLS